jgi:hypothetical protein
VGALLAEELLLPLARLRLLLLGAVDQRDLLAGDEHQATLSRSPIKR